LQCRRFANSSCPVCTHTLSFVFNDLQSAHLPQMTSFAGYSAPRVHQKKVHGLAQATQGRNWPDDRTSMPTALPPAGKAATRHQRRFKSGPRNQFKTHEAGTQDSGLFFCASYENWVAVFLASPEMSGWFRTRRSSPGCGLQTAANSTDSQRLMGCVQNSFPCFGKEVGFLRRSAVMKTTG
jgi:hypothetical protein